MGPVADDHQRQPELVEGGDRHIDLLVRHQLGNDQVVVADRPGGEPRRIHGRIDDRGLAPEVGSDPSLRDARVRDVTIGALRGRSSPTAASAGRRRAGPHG